MSVMGKGRKLESMFFSIVIVQKFIVKDSKCSLMGKGGIDDHGERVPFIFHKCLIK